MKYRIKTITYKDGSVKYTVEYNTWWIFWSYLTSWDSLHDCNRVTEYTQRNYALIAIDKDFSIKNSKKIKSIQIEYINK